jgi:hypothetical protein
LAENLSISRPATSDITPRPNWAGRPVTFSEVCTTTRVWSPLSSSRACTVADAVPAPLVSLPAACITIDRACGSFSVKVALPL